MKSPATEQYCENSFLNVEHKCNAQENQKAGLKNNSRIATFTQN